MAKIRFYPLDIDYKSGIRIFGKTEDNRKIIVLDHSLKPYFYAVPNEKEDFNKLKAKIEAIKHEDSYVIKAEIEDKLYLDNPIKTIKVSVNSSDALPVIKDMLKELGITKLLEYDIKFYKKYLRDRKITPLTLCEVEGDLKQNEFGVIVEGKVSEVAQDEIVNLKALAFDIEVYSFNTEDSEIISLSCYGDNFKKVITWKKFNQHEDIEFVNSEADLLERFKEILNEYKPDCIIGYNSDGFDFPFLVQRARDLGIPLDMGLDGTQVKISRGMYPAAKIKGIIHLDIMQFIKKIMAGSLKFDSYSLNNVAYELLKDKKLDIGMDKLDDMWSKEDLEDIKQICEYNLHDSKLTYDVYKKILPNLQELVKLIGLPLFDICRMSYGKLVENYLIKCALDLNELIPNQPGHADIHDRRMYTYQGASVMEPVPGFYKNIIVFDFMSLYPSIIVSKNVCPSMLNKSEGYESPEINEQGTMKTYFFSNKKEAFIPSVIKDLILRRNRVKELIRQETNPVLEARSYALKTVANSCYGYMGFFGARWYCRECASSITAWAREYIKETITKFKKEGFNVLYSDTDSVAVELQNKTKDEAFAVVEEINRELPSLMELEFDDFYPLGIFVSKKTTMQGAKKKYALIDECGNIKLTGFETVRRDWSKIARETQKQVLTLILEKGNPTEALEYTKNILKKIKDKEVLLKELIIQTQLKKNLEDYEQIGPHVAVARKMQEQGKKISIGSPIWFIVTEGKGMIRDRSKIPSECREKEYDTDYYINNQVLPCVEKIFEVFGVKKEQILIQEQSTLQDFK
ncbi:MAG: DNA-directed DNA polymerase [Candidatus Nanoarchaeia archaeon]